MSIPQKVTIQIINKEGKINPLPNILFGLKILGLNTGWYNYSFLKSDSKGQIALSAKQIIDNTQINYVKDIQLLTEFEIYVWDSKLINDLILVAKRIADTSKNKNSLNEELIENKGLKEDILGVSKDTSAHDNTEIDLYEFLKDEKNSKAHVYTERIQSIWINELPQSYDFIIELLK